MNNPLIRKTIRIILSLTILLNSGVAFSDSKRLEKLKASNVETLENAHMTIDSRAHDSVLFDFQAMLNQIDTAAVESSKLLDGDDVITGIMDGLNKVAQDIINTKPSAFEMNAKKLDELKSQFQQLVRDRFDVSLQMTNASGKPEQIISKLRSAVNQFENTCRSGRGLQGADFSSGKSLKAHDVDYKIMFSYNTGISRLSGSNSQISFNGSATTESDSPNTVQRHEFADILNTTTGIVDSIALSGSTGSVVALSKLMAPYFTVFAVVVFLINISLDMEEQAKFADKVIKLNNIKYSQFPTQTDFGKYYQAHCAPILSLLERINYTINRLEESEAQRFALLETASQSRDSRQSYFVATNRFKQDLFQFEIYNASLNENCLGQRKQAKPDKAICVQNGETVSSIEDSTFEFTLDKPSNLINLEHLKAGLSKYILKYPPDVRLNLISDLLVDILVPNWEELDHIFTEIGLGATDLLIERAFKNLDNMIRLYRIKKSNVFFGDEPPDLNVDDDIKTFNNFKSEYLTLLQMAAHASVKAASPRTFNSKVLLFAQKCEPFIAKYPSKPVIHKFGVMVQQLKLFAKSIQ